MTKEFDNWQETQEAIRAWCKENPQKEPPDWMVQRLKKTEAAYHKAKDELQDSRTI